ncbi:MAG: hypothetical protein H6811_00190 [Phycisphaeraceae bacterium]|nr:hypothetical protein [Phycisphaeraceae bacterium]
MATLLVCAGCNIAAPAYLLIHGPPRTEPVFELDESRSVVVFVDDRKKVVSRKNLIRAISDSAEKALLDKGATGPLISSAGARLAAEQGARPLSIAEIGQAVGADLVIYVFIDTFTLSPDGQTFSPTTATHVKIIESATAKRIWPEQADGYPRTLTMPTQQGTVPTTSVDVLRAQEALAAWTGMGVAQLFYSHERTTDAGLGH